MVYVCSILFKLPWHHFGKLQDASSSRWRPLDLTSPSDRRRTKSPDRCRPLGCQVCILDLSNPTSRFAAGEGGFGIGDRATQRLPISDLFIRGRPKFDETSIDVGGDDKHGDTTVQAERTKQTSPASGRVRWSEKHGQDDCQDLVGAAKRTRPKWCGPADLQGDGNPGRPPPREAPTHLSGAARVGSMLTGPVH